MEVHSWNLLQLPTDKEMSEFSRGTVPSTTCIKHEINQNIHFAYVAQ